MGVSGAAGGRGAGATRAAPPGPGSSRIGSSRMSSRASSRASSRSSHRPRRPSVRASKIRREVSLFAHLPFLTTPTLPRVLTPSRPHALIPCSSSHTHALGFTTLPAPALSSVFCGLDFDLLFQDHITCLFLFLLSFPFVIGRSTSLLGSQTNVPPTNSYMMLSLPVLAQSLFSFIFFFQLLGVAR